jgi:hypothetical protein
LPMPTQLPAPAARVNPTAEPRQRHPAPPAARPALLHAMSPD